MNNIIENMTLIRHHVMHGGYTIEAVLNDIILCHYADSDTYSTYRVTKGAISEPKRDMTAAEGRADLIVRGSALTSGSGWYIVTLTISIAQYEKQNTHVVQADDIESAELAALRAESVYTHAGFDSEGSWCDDDMYYAVESSRQLAQLEATVARGIL